MLALELEDIQDLDFDLSLAGFDPGEIDKLLALEDDEKANATWDRIEYSAAMQRASKLLSRLLGGRKPG